MKGVLLWNAVAVLWLPHDKEAHHRRSPLYSVPGPTLKLKREGRLTDRLIHLPTYPTLPLTNNKIA